jgi:hypothetical protein
VPLHIGYISRLLRLRRYRGENISSHGEAGNGANIRNAIVSNLYGYADEVQLLLVAMWLSLCGSREVTNVTTSPF